MRKLLLCLFLSATILVSKAQDDASIPEPEFINQIFLLDKDRKLMSLEKTEAEIKTKSKIGGFGGMKQSYIMNGAKSTVSLPATDLMFVFSNGGASFAADPSSQYQLLKFETKKNNREALSPYGTGGKKSTTEQNEISLNFKKLKDGVFGIVPAKPLDKGEYAFINKLSMQGGMSMKMEAYAFSVQ